METTSPGGLTLPGPVRFLSDLHLGHDMCTLGSVAELWPLIDGAGTVVFNGDTTEERSTHFRARSMDRFAELQALCARAGAGLVCINGNHDPERWPHDWLDLADGRLFVTHGHALLRYISPWSPKTRNCIPDLERIWSEYTPEQLDCLEVRHEIARRCSLAMPPGETRQRDRGLAARISLFFREIWPPSRPLRVLQVWAGLPSTTAAFTEQFRPKARVVLVGHTHRAASWRRGGRLIVNTGGFVTFARPLLAEMKDGRLSVYHVNSRNGEHHPGKLMVSESLEG